MARARRSSSSSLVGDGLALVAALVVLLLATGPAAAAAAKPTGPLSPVADDTGLAFSGSGFLGAFHLGALQALQDLGLATQQTRVAGTSGGSLISGISCLGLNHKDALDVANSINAECRGEWSCAGQLDRAVKGAMHRAVTAAMLSAGKPNASQRERDAFVVQRCSGRAKFTVSRVDPSQSAPIKSAQAIFVSDFQSEDDFCAAGAASSYIPLFSGLGLGQPAARPLKAVWWTTFRGQPAIDGGFTSPLPPCVRGVGTCVRIRATTKDQKPQPAEIYPGAFSPMPDGLNDKTWQQHALIAPRPKIADDMEKHGYEQAVAWACRAHPTLMASGPQGKWCVKRAHPAPAPGPQAPPRRMGPLGGGAPVLKMQLQMPQVQQMLPVPMQPLQLQVVG